MPLWLRRLLRRPPRTAWFGHPLMRSLDTGVNHPDSPERLPAIETALKEAGVWPKLMKREAEEAPDASLALVHSRNYLMRLEAAQPRPGKISRLDSDTVLAEESLRAARLAAGSVIKAVDYVLAGKAHNAFCAARPPGHHAESKKSGSFCVINNLAVGVMHAFARHRVGRVAVLDFDVHRGNGTEEIFADHPQVLYLGVSENELYPFDGEPCRGSNPHMHNSALPPQADSLFFRRLVREQWLLKLREFEPEMVFLSAGFDAHRDEELSDTRLHEADYAWLTHKIMQAAPQCAGKIVSVLEGGYSLSGLSKSAAAHLYVLCGMGKPDYAVRYERKLKKQQGGAGV